MDRKLGRHHPTVRRLRALRRDAQRRADEAVLVGEGIHLTQEALDSGASVELVVASSRLAEREEGRRLVDALEARSLPLFEVDEAVLTSIQDARSPQPVLSLIRRPSWPPDAGLDAPTPLVVVTHDVQDPGNLGALLRTAHAAGAGVCFVAGRSADPFHPRAVRASMGSILRLPVSTVDADALLTDLGARGIHRLGADPAGEIDYDACDLRRPIALFFGSEGQGLPIEILARLDERVRIPLRPGVDSLSVGAAAAVLLFACARQRNRGS